MCIVVQMGDEICGIILQEKPTNLKVHLKSAQKRASCEYLDNVASLNSCREKVVFHHFSPNFLELSSCNSCASSSQLVMEVLVHYCNLLGCSTSTIQWRDRKKAKVVVNMQASKQGHRRQRINGYGTLTMTCPYFDYKLGS
ncbi:hypothetical protein XENORESO_009252 [Xenotaenia resolanae]|uniref:Uncharacterized protein n=1 Tax=Xenotaenia resolanae TaxID=208358 RepID=A0ABV0X3X7_9TELE